MSKVTLLRKLLKNMRKLVRPSEFESPTSSMSRMRSNQLSYGRIILEVLNESTRRYVSDLKYELQVIFTISF